MTAPTSNELAAIREYLAGRETLLGNAAIRSLLLRMHNDVTEPRPERSDGMDSVTEQQKIVDKLRSIIPTPSEMFCMRDGICAVNRSNRERGQAADEIERLQSQLTAQSHECRRLRSALQLCSDAMDLEVWDGRWTNRMMQAHAIARDTLDQVAAGQPAPATEPEWIAWRQKRDANIIDRLCKRVAALESLVEVE